MKQEPEGFQRYLQLRQEKLAVLDASSIEVRIAAVDGGAPRLRIQVKDTGAGFDHRHVFGLEHDVTSPYGRGIPMLRHVCENVEYRGCGNEVEVLFSLGEPDAGRDDPEGGLNARGSEPLMVLQPS